MKRYREQTKILERRIAAIESIQADQEFVMIDGREFKISRLPRSIKNQSEAVKGKLPPCPYSKKQLNQARKLWQMTEAKRREVIHKRLEQDIIKMIREREGITSFREKARRQFADEIKESDKLID